MEKATRGGGNLWRGRLTEEALALLQVVEEAVVHLHADMEKVASMRALLADIFDQNCGLFWSKERVKFGVL